MHPVECMLIRWGELPIDYTCSGPFPMRSFTRQFLELIYADMSEVTQSIRDIYNLSRDVSSHDGFMADAALLSLGHPGLDALDDMLPGGTNITAHAPGQLFLGGSGASISSDVGIVVGTSSTAVNVSDYKLQGQLVHGTGGNQLIHYGTWGYNHTVASGTASFVIERIFRQDSNGSVTINEMGLYAASRPYDNGNFAVSSFCIARDVLGAPITMSSGQFLRATYTFQVSE